MYYEYVDRPSLSRVGLVGENLYFRSKGSVERPTRLGLCCVPT